MRQRRGLFILVFVTVALFGALALTVWGRAAPSTQLQAAPGTSDVLHYQGVLGDESGLRLTGAYSMTFKLYAQAQGGTALWTETQPVTVTNGLFNAYLGDRVPLGEDLFSDQTLFLGVAVDTDGEMAPRLRMASVPYAFGAQQVLCTRRLWYRDQDGDGYGDPFVSYEACEAPPGYVADNTDCNDADPAVNPEVVWYEDSDGDTYGNADESLQSCTKPAGYVRDNADCDDGDADINPAADEVCENGVDDNCDGEMDELTCVCLSGWTNCGGGYCVDTMTDAEHCGGCSLACDPGQACASGICQ